MGRQWRPKRVRLRRDGDGEPPSDARSAADLLDVFGLDFGVGGLLLGFVFFIVGALALFVVWPIIAVAIEIVLLAVVFTAGMVGRVVLRRPWRVVASSTDPPTLVMAWHVVGWRASGRVIESVAGALERGEPARHAGAQWLEPRVGGGG